jgi:hypothetical protein
LDGSPRQILSSRPATLGPRHPCLEAERLLRAKLLELVEKLNPVMVGEP